MKNSKWFSLQIFAGEGGGAGTGAGEGAATGESPADAGQGRLRELGVPEQYIQQYKPRKAAQKSGGQEAAKPQTEPQAEAPQAEPAAAESQQTLDWETIKQNPDFNNRIQAMVRQRLKSEHSAQEQLQALAPILQQIAQERGMKDVDLSDMSRFNAEEFGNKLRHDKGYVSQVAAELGVDDSVAQELTELRDMRERVQKEERQRQLREAFNSHMAKLSQEAEELKATVPDFDLRAELQNERFAQLTSPQAGVSVKDAYYALHHEQLQAQGMAVAARRSEEKIAAAVRANAQRPVEGSTNGQVAAVQTRSYKDMSPQEKKELRDRIAQSAYTGRKIYPGR